MQRLKNYRLSQIRLERAEKELAVWQARSALCDCADIIALCQREISSAAAERFYIEQTVNSVADERLRTLLKLRYIDGLTMEEVSYKLDIDLRWANRLHSRAIACLSP